MEFDRQTYSFYYLAEDRDQKKACDIAVERLTGLGVPAEKLNWVPVQSAKPASKRAGTNVRLPRVFIGDRALVPKRLNGGLAWFEGWMDGIAKSLRAPQPEAPSEPAAESPHDCPYCPIKDEQIKTFKEKAKVHGTELQKAHGRISELKRTAAGCRVNPDKMLEVNAQLQYAIGTMVEGSRELIRELEAVREDRKPKDYTMVEVISAIQFCTGLIPNLRSADQEGLEEVRNLLWHLTTLR